MKILIKAITERKKALALLEGLSAAILSKSLTECNEEGQGLVMLK